MDKQFWQQKWQSNDIAFHQGEANPLLVKYFHMLNVAMGSRILLPLCGKTLDIAWLLSKGYRVVGVELSELAITQLFAELGVQPVITQQGKLQHYHAGNLDIYVGDIFDLSPELLGTVDALYDRAALVALPASMRPDYAKHITMLSAKARQLLITFDYDQSLLQGPPFAISREQLQQYYGQDYSLNLAASVELQGGLKGQCPAIEKVWLLQKQRRCGIN